MSYAICFDFPESIDPFFARWDPEGLAFTSDLSVAMRFTDDVVAQRTLDNGYGPETRQWGVVVEVDRVPA